ncbi:MAG: FAD-dependent oxidoreductase [Candidatus Omnitrophica bacterium]|nr:FAD-dependent oxidoreductase [Candidatus Omnitrophota bacterium]
MSKKVVIVGGGFAGINALKTLARSTPTDLEITLVDTRRSSQFLPLLPDIIGKRIPARYLQYPLAKIAGDCRARFVCDEVIAIDTQKSILEMRQGKLDYDYLIISPGTVTNFYGNDVLKEQAYTFNDIDEVKKIVEVLKRNEYSRFIIAGGGYTGIELATNIRAYLDRNNQNKTITIVEKTSSLLGPLPEWIKKHVERNLDQLKIGRIYNATVKDCQNKRIELSDGQVFEDAMFLWVSGVRTPFFCAGLTAQKLPQNRLPVDRYLRLEGRENIFVAGDTAYFEYHGVPLRLSVQAAVTQGQCAGRNLIRSIQDQRLIPYQPCDLGYVVPLANDRAYGVALGVKVKGRIGMFLHYILSIYRSYGMKNKWGIIHHLITGGRK